MIKDEPNEKSPGAKQPRLQKLFEVFRAPQWIRQATLAV
jgi:hypothetical protein